MNRDQVEGRIMAVKGLVLEVRGRWRGEAKLAQQGRALKTAGHLQASYGDLKHRLRKNIG